MSEDLDAFMAGAEVMRTIKNAQIRQMEVQLADLRRELTGLYERKGWLCGCGHTNGINLALCAACERTPLGQHK